ncbi:cysteine desulfurase [Conyzicola nivalis]|uniref:Cysteine desulfurase n=1 Tax=Conyzicola nivalis TaxID=1477021 RepID=A0ABV2QM23_9MICO
MAIYLDHAATSPMPPEVIAAYASALAVVGNPASIHTQGQNAKRMLEEARERVAASVGADSVEVTFTGGGTEAVNLGIKGLWWARASTGPATDVARRRILVPRGEHHATIDTIDWLEQHEGAVIEWIPIDGLGRIDLLALEAALGPDVALVTLLGANNEVGTVQPVAEVAALAAVHDVPVHVDAIAGYGYLPIDFHALGVAAMSISAHKIGGPVGIGALVIARSATIVPLFHGGNQQRARSGTQDVAGAVAFGLAASQATADLEAHAASLRELRDRLVAGIRDAVPTAILRGDPTPEGRLPGNAHFTFPGCEGDSLLFLLDVAGFSVSTGSACQAGVPEASHVLIAMGLSEADARGALRMTLGTHTTRAEVDALVAALPDAVARAGRAGLAERQPTFGR